MEKNILVSAYCCEPLKGSEQGVGWNWVIQMAKTNEVHVITRANNKEPIEACFPDDLRGQLIFHYYDLPNWLKKFKKGEQGLYLYYFFWQIGIISLIKELKKEYKFDYSMHLTLGSVWQPMFLPFFDMPFIWGPVGGAENIPYSFLSSQHFSQKLLQLFRYFLKSTILFNPFFLIAACRAKVVLCRTSLTSGLFSRLWAKKVRLISDGGIESSIFSYQSSYKNSDKTIKLLLTSRFVGTKNIRSAIIAMLYVPQNYNVHLYIIGDGIEREGLENLVCELDLSSKVTIGRSVPREDVFSLLADSDVYLFPSLKEACNLSLLEAMAVGVPVICLNWSGMALATDENSAIRLPVTNPEQMPKDMASAICLLIEKPELRKEIGQNARQRIKDYFSWESKGEFMENLFCELDKTF